MVSETELYVRLIQCSYKLHLPSHPDSSHPIPPDAHLLPNTWITSKNTGCSNPVKHKPLGLSDGDHFYTKVIHWYENSRPGGYYLMSIYKQRGREKPLQLLWDSRHSEHQQNELIPNPVQHIKNIQLGLLWCLSLIIIELLKVVPLLQLGGPWSYQSALQQQESVCY